MRFRLARQLTSGTCLCTVIFLTSSSAQTKPNSRSIKPMPSQQLPTIALKLGDDLQTIQRQSTYQFSKRELDKIDALPVGEPVTVLYNRPGCSFTLPPSRSFAAAMNNGRAVSLTVSPQLEFLSLTEAINLIHTVNRTLEGSNWRRPAHFDTVENVQSQFSDSKVDTRLAVTVEDWHCGDDEIYFELVRHWRGGESLPLAAGKNYDFFVVSVKIENDRIRAQYPGR